MLQNISVAKHSGFCFGVRRAIDIVETTLKELKGTKNIYSLGPLIHNDYVVGSLKRRGLCVINDKQLNKIKNGIVIISSHGADSSILDNIVKKRLTLIDATCPFVKEAHSIVKRLRKEGYRVIIIGDRTHPEVKALLSLAGRGIDGNPKKIAIISQTTQTKDNYLKGIINIFNKNDFKEIRIFNTICKDTSKRQRETEKILEDCDLMLVIGGHKSANTKRLYEICTERGVDTYHIEAQDELKKEYFLGRRRIGIVSGASTPDIMVKEVVERIKEIVTTETRKDGDTEKVKS